MGERLIDGEYQPFPMREDEDGRVWARSDALNLDLYWDNGELRYWDPVAENWLLNHEEDRVGRLEERAGRLAAEERAEAAESRAAQDRAARQAAESRLAELQAQLRQLRGE